MSTPGKPKTVLVVIKPKPPPPAEKPKTLVVIKKRPPPPEPTAKAGGGDKIKSVFLVVASKKRPPPPPEAERPTKKPRFASKPAAVPLVDRIPLLYSVVEERRKDVFYNLFDGEQPELLMRYIEGLPTVIYETFRTERLRELNTSVDSKGGLELEDRVVWLAVVQKKDRILHDALVFFALYALPSFLDYFINGNPARDEPPPFQNNPDVFRLFVDKYVKARSVELVNGKLGPGGGNNINAFTPPTAIEAYVLSLRMDYIRTCGLHRPRVFEAKPFRHILEPPPPPPVTPMSWAAAQRSAQRAATSQRPPPPAPPPLIDNREMFISMSNRQKFLEMTSRAQAWKCFRLRAQCYMDDRRRELENQDAKIRKPAAMRKAPLSGSMPADKTSTMPAVVENEREANLSAVREQQQAEKKAVDREDLYDG